MEFNINEVVANMFSAIKSSVSQKDWDHVSGDVIQMLDGHKGRLQLLAELRINGDITEKRFQSRLNDEQLILEAEMHSITVITLAVAQKAINAAIEVMNQAIKAAIKGI